MSLLISERLKTENAIPEKYLTDTQDDINHVWTIRSIKRDSWASEIEVFRVGTAHIWMFRKLK